MLSEREVRSSQDPAEAAEGWGMLRAKTSRTAGWATFVRLEGDLDIYSTREFSDALRRAEAGTSDLVVDLSGLNFIDCAGLHQLVEAGQRARAKGGRLRLVKGPERVHRVFRLTGMDSGFEFVAEPD
jgi:anti-sigma B factor antagonist